MNTVRADILISWYSRKKKTIQTFQPLRNKGQHMKIDNVELLKIKNCGKIIVSVEPSKWSGEVKSLMKTQDFVSLTLDDGTVLEVGGLYLRDGSRD